LSNDHASPGRGAPVLIVGAGLAGLACALELQARSIPFQIVESSDAAGGRVRTDLVDGFRLDRGFQVYLTAYPEGQRLLDYPALAFQNFLPGAMVRFGERFHRVMDPWREPFSALQSLLNPVGSIVDKLRVARLRASSLAGTVEQLLARPETTTRQALENYGFSQQMIERFFEPFFGGILLDRELRVTSRMLEFVFRMMAVGDTVLPEKGMGEIPKQLAAKLPPAAFVFGRKVKAVGPTCVQLDDGELVKGSAVVVATEGPEAHRLLPELPAVGSRPVCNLYFAAETAPLKDPIIVMNANRGGLVHNFCVPSVISPAYAPEGQHLMSATVLGNPLAGNSGPGGAELDDEQLRDAVHAELTAWFGGQTARWRFLKLYRIRHAHPILGESKGISEKRGRLGNGVYVCGDHRFLPSIHAALLNGRHVAQAVADRTVV
jgi:phytoene dehydrogenase-like protein